MKKRSWQQALGCSAVLGMLVAGTSLLGAVTGQAQGNQAVSEEQKTTIFDQAPQSTALFPEGLAKWQLETDPDAPFNVSNVPLVPRVQGSKMNPDQSTKAKVLSLAIVNRHTKGTPSQGDSDKAVYNFTNWQYVDTLVAWAGSSGEGIIVPPSGDVTDSAHRNGVPVLGTVFFPPEAYGGKSEWVKQFVAKDANGRFIMADKLLEMSEAYGFDGWFINQETNVDRQTATQLKELLKYLQAHKRTGEQVIWYDSMVPSGSVSWQGALNATNSMYFQEGQERVSDQLFIDFRWNNLTGSKNKATELGRSPYELAAGIDVQANGVNSYRKPSSIIASGEPIVSLGLYCPDWTLRDGAQYNIDKYWENEKLFWTNPQGDPRSTNSTSNQWQGVSRYFVEKTPVTTMPFVTNFNTGTGDNFYLNGKQVKAGTFNNRSIQEVMPTYRWIIDNGSGNNLKASIAYETAFNGGTSIKLSGDMTKNQESYLKLYASDLAIQAKDTATLVSKGADVVQLVVTVEGTTEPITISGEAKETVNGWQTTQYSLAQLAGKKVTTIGTSLKQNQTGGAAIYLGRLVMGQEQKTSVGAVTQVSFPGKTVVDDVTESVRVSWETSGEAAGYHLYREVEGQWQFEGATTNTAYTLLNQKRLTDTTVYHVVPVDLFGQEKREESASAEYAFEAVKKPTLSVNADKTIVANNEAVTFTANVSASTEEINWEITGGTPNSGQGKTFTTAFSQPGNYTVKATAVNSAGATEAILEKYIYVYDAANPLNVENLSILSTTSATEGSGYTNDGESYRYALDGNLSTKWCDNSHDVPWMVADLGENKTISGFELAHAGAGGENSEWNTREYEIQVSGDGTTWQTVVEHRGNTENTSRDAIKPLEARYVKLILNKAEQNGRVARIYDWQILGVNQTGLIEK